MDLGLIDKKALLCGASTGIGYAIAEGLVREGCHLYLCAREYDRLEVAVKSLRRIDPTRKVEAITLDVGDESKIRKAVDSIVKEGGVDILLHNTGGPATGLTHEISLEEWDRGYRTLLRSVVVLNSLFLPGMMKRKWGRVLTITSTAARELIPKLPVSATFRAGLSAYAKALAKDVGRSGVLVNNLLPGPTNTARLQELKVKSPVFFESMGNETALGRIAEPDEIARIAVFLCSGANSYLTGTDILADGGYTKAI